MKITVKMTVDIEAMHYPLYVLNNFLARLINELNTVEIEHGDSESIFPIHSEMSYAEGDTGQLTIDIIKS